MKVKYTCFGDQTIGAIHFLVHNWVNTEPIPELPPQKPKVEEKKTVRFDKATKKLPPEQIADQQQSKPEDNKEGEV